MGKSLPLAHGSITYLPNSNLIEKVTDFTLTIQIPRQKVTITYTIPGQAPFTRVLDRSRDTLGRDTGFSLGSTPASGVGGGASPPPELVTSYAYNPTAGRLSEISNQIFSYTYTANSNLLSTVIGPIHTVTHTYEPNRDVLASKQNKVGTSVISQYDYTVNAIGQRTAVATRGTAFPTAPSWLWGYDAIGQLTRADSSINSSDRAYEYDAIGNRKKSSESLILAATENYTANPLNQYTAVSAVSPSYDGDGNAVSYPLPVAPGNLSALAWDAENRMISSTVGSITTTYLYDAQSRKIATTANGITTLYLYDAWNCIAEYQFHNSSFNLHTSRLWGIDLSGSMQGAGGVGGLLMVSEISNSQISNYFPTYDGNGNVSEYLNSSGIVVAHYEYDPFGNTTVATGTKATDFVYRFSTKPLDFATGL